ncbi:MAG: hypothetical protein RIS64_3870 [Bacteroidota bacterium]|jgi:hypothetical protein
MRKLCIAISLLFALNDLSAQSSRYAITLEGAPTFSYLKFQSPFFASIDQPIWRYYGGMTLYYALRERSGIVSGVGFERKGASSSIDFTDENGTFIGKENFIIQLDYVSVPILFRQILDTKRTFFVDMGGYWGCLIKEGYSVRYQSSVHNYTDKTLNINDFGVSLGVGMRLPLWKNWSIPITLRSQHSIFSLAPMPNPRNFNVRNNTAQLAIGLTYQYH